MSQPENREHVNRLYIYCFFRKFFSNFTVSVEQGLSDHHLVSVSLSLNSHSKQTKSFLLVKDYSRADDAIILEYMDSCLFDFNDNDVDVLWCQFRDMCLRCLYSFVPNKRKRVHKQTPWMTRNLIQLKRKHKRLKRRHAQSPSVIALREQVLHALRASKHNYFQTLLPNFIKHDPTKFWIFISEQK